MSIFKDFSIWKNNELSLGKILMLIACMLVPICVGAISGYITKDNMVVFDSINKPLLTPPAVVFPIAWSVLYLLMGLSSYVALSNCEDARKAILTMYPYLIQLILNFSWSLFFFNSKWYGIAFICLVLMWLMIIRTMAAFWTVSRLSFYLLMPYLVWVTFAGYLNLSIVLLNKQS